MNINQNPVAKDLEGQLFYLAPVKRCSTCEHLAWDLQLDYCHMCKLLDLIDKAETVALVEE